MSTVMHVVGQVDCHTDMRNKEFGVQFREGAHQMEPESPILALGVNPFPIRFIKRTVPWEVSRADRGKSQ